MPVGLTVPGRLGADPDLRSTNGGTVVANFRVAVSGYDREKQEKTTTWVRVTMWGARGEQIAKLVGKGDSVCFIGTGELKSFEKREGGEIIWYLECTASDCVLLGSSQKSDEPREKQPPMPASKPAHRGRVKEAEADDDEIPF